MNIEKLNLLPDATFKEELFKCCGSQSWIAMMTKARPFKTWEEFLESADSIWKSLNEKDWLEAFSHHPKIGDTESLLKKFSSTAAWAGQEQKGVVGASKETILNLQALNVQYEKKNGFIFLICATGKSAEEMLQALNIRLKNARDIELKIAMQEQAKITKLRLEKWIKLL